MKPSLTLQQSHSLENSLEATQRTAQPNSVQVLAHKILIYNQMGVVLALPDCLVVKNLPANAGDAGAAVLIPGSGRSPGVGNGKPTPVFLPGGSHGQRVAQSWTQLSTHTHARTACHAQIPNI